MSSSTAANIYNFGVHTYHRYITLSGHLFGATGMICNEEHYRNWPPDVQAAVDEAAREATALQRRLAAARIPKYWQCSIPTTTRSFT